MHSTGTVRNEFKFSTVPLIYYSGGVLPWTAEIRAHPGTLVGDKNTTFGPVQDAINLFRYIYIVVYGIYICIMYINIWYIYT